MLTFNYNHIIGPSVYFLDSRIFPIWYDPTSISGHSLDFYFYSQFRIFGFTYEYDVWWLFDTSLGSQTFNFQFICLYGTYPGAQTTMYLASNCRRFYFIAFYFQFLASTFHLMATFLLLGLFFTFTFLSIGYIWLQIICKISSLNPLLISWISTTLLHDDDTNFFWFNEKLLDKSRNSSNIERSKFIVLDYRSLYIVHISSTTRISSSPIGLTLISFLTNFP